MPERNTAASDVIVVGAGLAGLACAIHLQNAGRAVTVLEASNGVGGRVRSDLVSGFTLDRGFQVLLTAYPEAKAMLDYSALRLRKFRAGAFVQLGDTRCYVADPLREPLAILETLKADIGSPADKARIALLQFHAMKRTPVTAFSSADRTTADYLAAKGFSKKFVDRFFRPLFGGVFLEDQLTTSSRMFEFVFSTLARGDNAIPASGMGAITEQLAAKLAPGTIRLGARVTDIRSGSVTLLDQVSAYAASIVVATEGPVAAKLLQRDQVQQPASQPVSCLYYGTDHAPYDRASITVNGLGAADGPVSNMCVPSALSPDLAPPGRHLISVSVLGSHATEHDTKLDEQVRVQLTRWFGAEVGAWDHLRTYNIHDALPAQPPGALSPPERPVALGENLYVCGDHRDQASINGALVSGRRAAEAILTTS